MIPFNKTFKGENIDVHIFEKLKSELPGILNFALHGVGRVMAIGKLTEPESSGELKDEFLVETDSVYAFYKECCFEHPSMGFVPSFIFYNKYNQFCDAGNRKPRKDNVFYKSFKKLVPEKFHERRNHAYGYKGLSLELPSDSTPEVFIRKGNR